MTLIMAKPTLGLLSYAVTDGPNGSNAESLTGDRDGALRLKSQHQFWCSSAAGGCGGAMGVVAGEIVRPYFRHYRSEDSASCAFVARPEIVEPSYAHLRYQRDLVAWLDTQGLQASVEQSFADGGGRADLHVIVEQVAQSIEVQLSPLGDRPWQERDARYRQHVQQVTWLYGPGAEAAAAREHALRGVSLQLRRDADGEAQIGVYGDLSKKWSRLADCRLEETGIWTPQLARVRQEHAARAAREAELSELAWSIGTSPKMEQPVRSATEIQAERAQKQEAAEQFWESSGMDRQPEAGADNVLARPYPEAPEWIDRQDWRWLENLAVPVDNAQLVTYVVFRIYFNGTTDMLGDPESAETQRLIAGMQAAGIISLSSRFGYRRWQRGRELAVS